MLMGLLNYVIVLEVITTQNAETPTYCFTHAQAVNKVIKMYFVFAIKAFMLNG